MFYYGLNGLLSCHQGFSMSEKTSHTEISQKSRTCEIGCQNDRIALKLDRRLNSTAVEPPVKFQSGLKTLNTDLAPRGFARSSDKFKWRLVNISRILSHQTQNNTFQRKVCTMGMLSSKKYRLFLFSIGIRSVYFIYYDITMMWTIMAISSCEILFNVSIKP